MYVPIYQPDQVYYDSPGGIPFITFGIGCPIGPWFDNDCDWGNNEIIVWTRDHPRPANWWHEPRGQRNTGRAAVWRPENRGGTAVTNRGDRGWAHAPTPSAARSAPVAPTRDSAFTGAAPGRPTPAVTGSAPVAPRRDSAFTGGEPVRPAPPQNDRAISIPHPAPTPVEHAQPIHQPEANGALIGIQSPRDTRTFSDRGQQSMHAMAPPAPVSRPAPTFHSAPAPASHPAAAPAPAGHSGGGGGGGRK